MLVMQSARGKSLSEHSSAKGRGHVSEAKSNFISATTLNVVFDEAKSNFISATTLNVVFDDNTINEIPIVKEDSTVVVDTIPVALDRVPESTPTELELNGYARGKCMDNDLAVKPVTKSAVSDLPEARQITYMNGMTVLTLENVMDYCGIDAKVSQKMVGDTLILDYYDQSAVTKCICNFDQIDA